MFLHVNSSFLFIVKEYFIHYMDLPHYPFIRWWNWTVSTFRLLSIIDTYMPVWGRHLFSFLLGLHLGVELLGHMLTSRLIFFLRTCKTVSKVAAPFHIPISSAWGSNFFAPLATLVLPVFLFLASPHSKWDLSPLTRDRTPPLPTLEAWSLNHQTTRLVPCLSLWL